MFNITTILINNIEIHKESLELPTFTSTSTSIPTSNFTSPSPFSVLKDFQEELSLYADNEILLLSENILRKKKTRIEIARMITLGMFPKEVWYNLSI